MATRLGKTERPVMMSMSVLMEAAMEAAVCTVGTSQALTSVSARKALYLILIRKHAKVLAIMFSL